MTEYIMIPRSITLNKDLGDKRVLVLSSILFSGWSGTDLESLVRYSDYSTGRDKSGILNQFKHIIDRLVQDGYLQKTTGGVVYIKPSSNFCTIHNREFQKIMQLRRFERQSGKRMNHAHLILLLAYIRLNMIRIPGVPEYYSDLLIRISDNIGLSVRSISACIATLEQLEIIHSEELPRYKDKEGCWHSNVKVFVNMERYDQSVSQADWRNNTSRAIKYIRSNRKVSKRIN